MRSAISLFGLAARIVAAVVVLIAVGVIGIGYLLDPPESALQPGQAIIVISGDEQLARFREGVRLYKEGYGQYLVFSGAAQDDGPSNAQVMRDIAVTAGVPASQVLEDSQGEDTWGNAVYTQGLLQQHGLDSAILVTSPYHLRRAKQTFDAAYQGSDISVVAHAAPDSEWRKLTWWSSSDTRRLTVTELQKLAYIAFTHKYD